MTMEYSSSGSQYKISAPIGHIYSWFSCFWVDKETWFGCPRLNQDENDNTKSSICAEFNLVKKCQCVNPGVEEAVETLLDLVMARIERSLATLRYSVTDVWLVGF